MAPSMVGLYTWEDSLGKREMLWTCGEKKDVKNDLSQVCNVKNDLSHICSVKNDLS